MVEYARLIYTAWQQAHTAEYTRTHASEILALIGSQLGYTPQEVLERISDQPWYLD